MIDFRGKQKQWKESNVNFRSEKYNILIWLDIKTQCGLNRLERTFLKKNHSKERSINRRYLIWRKGEKMMKEKETEL